LEAEDFVDFFHFLSFDLPEVPFGDLVGLEPLDPLGELVLALEAFGELPFYFLDVVLAVHQLLSEVDFFVVHLGPHLENVFVEDLLLLPEDLL
jgi:hypothetical protein